MIKLIKQYGELNMSIKIQKTVDLVNLWHKRNFFDLGQHQRITHLNLDNESKRVFENQTGEIYRG